MDELSGVSAEVKSFLRAWVTSYEQLQALLLLHGRRDDSFSTVSVAEVLHTSEPVAAEALEHLCRVSLVQVHLASSPPTFKYAPASSQLDDLVDQLADAWEHHQLTVMNLMSSNAIERVRTGALRAFADAFVLGKNKPDG